MADKCVCGRPAVSRASFEGGGTVVEYTCLSCNRDTTCCSCQPVGQPTPSTMESFVAKSEQRRVVLRRLEWLTMRPGSLDCPVCHASRRDGHMPDCDLAKSLESNS